MIKVVIDHATGNSRKVQIETPDEKSESQAFRTYQALRDEIRRFSKRRARKHQHGGMCRSA